MQTEDIVDGRFGVLVLSHVDKEALKPEIGRVLILHRLMEAPTVVARRVKRQGVRPNALAHKVKVSDSERLHQTCTCLFLC